MNQIIETRGKVINEWKGVIKGMVLKTNKKISFLGDINVKNGVIVAKDSDIVGASIVDKILVFPGGRGSTVGAGVLFGLAKRKLAPKMLITVDADQVVVSGAIFGDIPMVSFIPKEIFDRIKTGDIIEAEIAEEEAILRIIKR